MSSGNLFFHCHHEESKLINSRLLVFVLNSGTSGVDSSSFPGSSKAEDRRNFDPFSITSFKCCVAAHNFVVTWQNLQRTKVLM